MLISIVLILSHEAVGTRPAQLGRAVQAETLARLAQIDPGLTETLHAAHGPKPLTCSGLLPASRAASMPASIIADTASYQPNSRYVVRITGLTKPVSTALMTAFCEQRPESWQLHGLTFHVLDAYCDELNHPWASRTTAEQLVSVAFHPGASLPRSLTLQFLSPTAFRSMDMQVPLPLPGLVFGSLVERWNAFCSVQLDPSLRRFADEKIAISRYLLESRASPGKDGSMRIGGVGEVTYTVLDSDPYCTAAVNLLADFALYSGVGVQTAAGMGQCRRVRK